MLKRLLKTCLALALLIAALAALEWARFARQPLALIQPAVFTVEPGDSLIAVLDRWQARGWIAHPRDRLYLRLHARWQGLAGRIHIGDFEVLPGDSLLDALRLLVSGQTRQHALTVVEGWTFRTLRAALEAEPHIAQTLAGVDDAEVMRRLGQGGVHPEGQFFPDTYHFPRGTPDVEFLRRALRRMQAVLADEWARRDPETPLDSAYEALILASIIERETGVPAERAQIAGVFVRRLRRGMRLQTDPTVIYGLGEAFDGNLRRRDLAADTPYNTYTRAGLPPTPIALPGRASIHAALHPAPGDALFFVSRGDGSHVFSATLAEHNAAVRRYQLRKKGGQ